MNKEIRLSDKVKEICEVINQRVIAKDIYSLQLKTDKIAKNAKSGQFVSLYCSDMSRILPRPISICEVDKSDGTLRLVYRVVGEGTEEFSHLRPHQEVVVIGPLGNGYPDRDQDKRAFVVGGGLGIPPMLYLAKSLKCDKNIVLGYNRELFLLDEFNGLGDLYISTDDGSCGTKGNVIDAIKENALKGDVIYACGPMPMLRAIKAYALEHNIDCYISLEERMACGIGACLGCVCKSSKKDEHTNVNNKRICTQGPVFLAEEVQI